jgi:hypothetical protein
MGSATVKYQHGTYSGTVTVTCDDNDDTDIIIARAKKQLFKDAPGLSMCYESFKVIEREYDE